MWPFLRHVDKSIYKYEALTTLPTNRLLPTGQHPPRPTFFQAENERSADTSEREAAQPQKKNTGLKTKRTKEKESRERKKKEERWQPGLLRRTSFVQSNSISLFRLHAATRRVVQQQQTRHGTPFFSAARAVHGGVRNGCLCLPTPWLPIRSGVAGYDDIHKKGGGHKNVSLLFSSLLFLALPFSLPPLPPLFLSHLLFLPDVQSNTHQAPCGSIFPPPCRSFVSRLSLSLIF